MDFLFKFLDEHLEETAKRERRAHERDLRNRKLAHETATSKKVTNQLLFNTPKNKEVKVETIVNIPQVEQVEQVEQVDQVEQVEQVDQVDQVDQQVNDQDLTNDSTDTFEMDESTKNYIETTISDIFDSIVKKDGYFTWDKFLTETMGECDWKCDEELIDFDNQVIEPIKKNLDKVYTQSDIDDIQIQNTHKYNQLYSDYMCLYEEYFATKEKIAEYQVEIITLSSQLDNSRDRVDKLEKTIDQLMNHANVFKTELEILKNMYN